jgi:hypothetical protein
MAAPATLRTIKKDPLLSLKKSYTGRTPVGFQSLGYQQ